MEDNIALISNPPVANVITELGTLTPRGEEKEAPPAERNQWRQQVISAAICVPLLSFYVASVRPCSSLLSARSYTSACNNVGDPELKHQFCA